MRILILLLVITIGCKPKISETPVTSQESNDILDEERVIDSTSFGPSGQFKIDIRQVRYSDSGPFVEFKFFEKRSSHWITKQTFKEEKDGITSLELILADFNNDGYNDMTFRSGVAARGANVIRTLFLFDKEPGELIKIKNSADYPNLLYNEELECLDAWLVYGGSSTVFLRIEGDSLKEFAGVELFDGIRKVYEVDDGGKQKILKEERIGDMYTRYKNYKTLKVNDDENTR